MPTDDPFTGSLFSGRNGTPKSPGALFSRTIGLFPSGSYQPNPLTDPASGGKGLATWWESAWTELRSIIPPRSQLPPDANFDKNWADSKAGEITDALQGLESATTVNNRRGYADLALQKLGELQAELPLDALAEVPALTDATTAFRDASFTSAKGVVALTLNDDRHGETLRATYLQLELTDTAATHYWLGGDPPDSIEIPKGEAAGIYLGIAGDNLSVPDPATGKGNVATQFENLLVEYGTTQNSVNGLRSLPSRTAVQDQQLATAEKRLGDVVDSVANLTRAFARQTGEFAARDPKDGTTVQSAELAMVVAEAMRNVTGAIRPGAQPGVTDPLSPQQLADRRSAGEGAAAEMPDKFQERELEEAAPGI